MSERMLIIDDERIVLESCRKIFSSEGFDVEVTENPQEGLKKASDSNRHPQRTCRGGSHRQKEISV